MPSRADSSDDGAPRAGDPAGSRGHTDPAASGATAPPASEALLLAPDPQALAVALTVAPIPTAAATAADTMDLDAMLTAHLPALRAYVRHRADRLVSRKESVSDLVQSVCREVIEHLDRYEHPSAEGFRQWLFRTAERKIIDRYRYYTAEKRDAGREIDEGTPTTPPALFLTPSRDAIGREDLAAAEAAFARLSGPAQEVIMLSRVQGLSHAEIAQRMQRSEGAVRNLLYRGLAAISDALHPPAGGPGGSPGPRS
ncbi:MAG TPA: sigma-70 family RNA polymerase sigma factor [Planctomycetota bacterium]|nr:sigma-70 family RNA polymerase sigma factor [Planctomycetota bacterium]